MAEAPLLYLVRHGLTDANLERRYAGWSDDELNETGRRQAEALAQRLASEGVQHVFTSPVRRAVETAEILAEAWNANVRTVHDLHEITIGPWRGFTEKHVKENWPKEYQQWRDDPTALHLEGREPLDKLAERACQATDQIGRSLLTADPAPAVVVSHLAVIRVLWLRATNVVLSHYHRIAAPHCQVIPLRWLGRGRLETAGPLPTV